MMNKLLSLSALFFLFSFPALAQMEEGAPITAEVKPPVTISGKPVEISGNTIIGKEPLDVSVSITDPSGKETALNVSTDQKGNYKLVYNKAVATGKYTVKVKPADGKNEASAFFTVATINGAVNNLQTDLFKNTETVQRTLNTVIAILEQLPPSADLQQQTEKLKGYKQKLGEQKAADEKTALAIKELVKQSQDVPEAAEKVNQYLNDVQAINADFTEKIPAIDSKLATYANKSVKCEMINNIAELCGFISLGLDFKGKCIKVMINLASDKALPGLVDRVDWKGKDEMKESKKFAINSAQKGLVAAVQKSEEVAGFLKTGLTLDVCQYAFKVLYAQNCEELSGDIFTTFKSTFLADNQKPYAVYDVDLKGKLKLRYEKNTDLSKGALITGEISGYRARYGFVEDFEQVEKVPAGMTLLARQALSPRTPDLSAISGDLGAYAATMTPGSFRVALRGKVVNNELRLEIVPSPFDATETEYNNRIFVVLINGMLPIPVIQYFPVPIAKTKTMFIIAFPKDKVFSLQKNKDKVTVTEKAYKAERKLDGGVILSATTKMTLSN